MIDDTPKVVTNRAPICVTCRYAKRKIIETYGGEATRRSGFMGLHRTTEILPAKKAERYCCQLSRHPISGIHIPGRSCEDERLDPAGCALEGRNWMHNPDWIADIQTRGVEIHPDLMDLYEQSPGVSHDQS